MVSCNQNTNKDNNAINLSNMDTIVNPAVDFYQYANGGWMANNPLPDDKSRYGAFDVLDDKAREQVKSIFQELQETNAKDGSLAQKVSDFYNSGMSIDKRNKLGITPLKETLSLIDNISTKEALSKTISLLHQSGFSPVFRMYVGSDAKNSKMNIAHLNQGGLGLPNKDYYTDETSKFQEIRKEYIKHIETILTLAGIENPDQKAQNIFNLENKLANASRTPLELRDPILRYNKKSMDELQKLSSSIEWSDYFSTIGADNPGELIVGQPEFFESVSQLIDKESIEDWQDYLKWTILNSSADLLSENFVNADFDFYGKILSGKKENRPLWERIQDMVSGSLSETVGELYVAKYFPPKAKERMLDLVKNIKWALGERIAQLEWMSDETKVKAQEKLDAINVKIGYPNKWRNYSDMAIKDQSYFDNVMEARRFNRSYNISKMNKPVDPDEWFMPPQMVNAYYSSTKNEIVFPAAILQPPFFFMDGDDAVNYGAIGVVIGHELTHGFDDKGRKSDKNGNLNDWWTEEDAVKFEERADVLVNQFNEFTVIDDMKANGELTLGENIADLGGLNIALTAFDQTSQAHSTETIKGFTPKQRFFLSYAHIWAQNIRDEEIVRRTKTDVHSLGKYRVIGPLKNLPEFYQAFNIHESDYMYIPESERAVIW